MQLSFTAERYLLISWVLPVFFHKKLSIVRCRVTNQFFGSFFVFSRKCTKRLLIFSLLSITLRMFDVGMSSVLPIFS